MIMDDHMHHPHDHHSHHHHPDHYDSSSSTTAIRVVDSGGGSGGTEAVFSSLSSSSTSPDRRNNHHPNQDQESEASRDARDGATVALYFIPPTASATRAVCHRIQRYQRQSTMMTPPTPKSTNPFDPTSTQSSSIPPPPLSKHRIVFLSKQDTNDNPNIGTNTTTNTNTTIHAMAKRILVEERILPSTSSSSTSSSCTNRREITFHSIDIDLVPLDDDVLVCASAGDTTLRRCDVDGTPSDVVECVSQSILHKIQTVCGVIPRLVGIGVLGECIVEKCVRLRYDLYDPFLEDCDDHENDPLDKNLDKNNQHRSEIAAAIVLDRKVDLITPMLTPLTYEGLLDDVLQIENGFVTIDSNIVEPSETDESPSSQSQSSSSHAVSSKSSSSKQQPQPQQQNDRMSLPLNDLDTLYAEVRDQHVEKFGSFLQEQAKALKESHANFSDKNRDLSEIHQFVKQIPIFTQSLRSLTNHIHLAELVKATTERSEFRQRWQTERSMVESETCYDMLEDLIACQYPPFRLLRLLCLQSLTAGGLKASKFDILRREIVQTYGYEFLFVLQNLEKVGLLRKRESVWMETAAPFVTLRRQFDLIHADVDTVRPDDVAYVSSGYAPITVRLIEASMHGFKGKEEALRELPGGGGSSGSIGGSSSSIGNTSIVGGGGGSGAHDGANGTHGKIVDVVQRYPPEEYAMACKREGVGRPLGMGMMMDTTTSTSSSSNGTIQKKKKKPVLLVYYVGGVTFMEIAALRYLSKQNHFPYEIVILCTSIINGNSFLQSLA